MPPKLTKDGNSAHNAHAGINHEITTAINALTMDEFRQRAYQGT
jgi:hypothetical protein